MYIHKTDGTSIDDEEERRRSITHNIPTIYYERRHIVQLHAYILVPSSIVTSNMISRTRFKFQLSGNREW